MKPNASLKERFCPLPFEHIAAFRKGLAYACCPSWQPVSVGAFHRQELEEVWNSPELMLIRKSILDGSFRYCDQTHCPAIRSGSLPLRSEVREPRLRRIIDSGEVLLSDGPKILGLSADRSCNLSCPSCRKEPHVLASGPEYESLRELHRRLLEECLPGLRRLVISGSGDPLASPICRETLTSLDGSRYPRLGIHLLTNGQLLNQRMWRRLSKIHRNLEIIEIGIDAATAPTYAKLRRGGRLGPLLKNIEFVMSRRSGLRYQLWVTFVVQAANYREMPAFVRLAKELGASRCGFQRITDWKSYSPRELAALSVHRPEHPGHLDFLDILRDRVLLDPIVDLGNVRVSFP